MRRARRAARIGAAAALVIAALMGCSGSGSMKLAGPDASGSSGSTGSTDSGGGGDGVGAPPIVDLFDGTDLTGWVISTTWPPALSSSPPLPAADAQKIFQVTNGMIRTYGDAPDGAPQVRATLMTVASYTKYNLWVDYKWGTKVFAPYTDLAQYPRDAGLLFDVSGDRTQVWPSSIEFQIKENQTGDIYALNARCTSLALNGGTTFVDAPDGGTSKLIDGSNGNARHEHSAPYDSLTDWNTVQLSVDGDSAVYTVNGHVVNKVSGIQDKKGNRVTSGPIALQAEHAEVLYRNVRLQVLP